MPLSRTLEEEGMIIPPLHLYRRGELDQALMGRLTAPLGSLVSAQGPAAAWTASTPT